MKTDNINEIVTEGRSAGDPTPIFDHLKRIYVFGILALILIAAGLLWWTGSNRATTNASGTDSSNINAVQPPS